MCVLVIVAQITCTDQELNPGS